jgi:hypothetical protein
LTEFIVILITSGVIIYFTRLLNLAIDGRHTIFDSLWPCLFFSLSLAANFISTGESIASLPFKHSIDYVLTVIGLLAFRIYKVNREVASTQETVMKSHIRPILWIAIDAAILYSILLLAAIGDAIKHSNDTMLVINMVRVPSRIHVFPPNSIYSLTPYPRSFPATQSSSTWSSCASHSHNQLVVQFNPHSLHLPAPVSPALK